MFRILLELLHRTIKCGELAEKYQLSERSIYRYMDELERCGIPLLRTSGPRGGYSISDAELMDKAYLTHEEYETVITLLGASGITAPAAKSALGKLSSLNELNNRSKNFVINTAQLVIDSQQWSSSDATRQKLSEFQRAAKDCVTVRIDYIDNDLKQTQRAVEPHTLVLKEGVWYVYAYCRVREDFRLFALSRIARYLVLPERFTRREYDIVTAPWNTPPAFTDVTEVRLHFDNEVRHLVGEWLGYSALKNNAAVTKLPLNNATVSHILSYGAHMTVVSPPKLADSVAEALRTAAKNYPGPQS